jgi:uncharacterized membrane protein
MAMRGQISFVPLPSPDALEAYEQILPGTANRLLQMAEKQQEHEHKLDVEDQRILGRTVDFDYKGFRAGQWMGFALACTTVGFAFALAWKGNNVAAAGFGLSGLAILVGLFLRSRFATVSQEKPEEKG